MGDDSPPAPAGFWRAFLSVLGISALVLVIALAVALQVVPRILGGTSLTVLTGSMQPTLRPGDVIAVRAPDPTELRAGDIITFQPVSDDPTLVTHRIVGVGSDTVDGRVFTTRGDANGADDPSIVAAQVKGVYMYRVPLLGYVVGAAGTHGPLLASLIGLVLVGYAVFAFIRPHRRAAAGAAMLVLALGAGPLASPPPAAADELDVQFAGPTINLDWRGQPYTTSPPGFFGDRTVVPGDRIARDVVVTNAGPTAGILSASLDDPVVVGGLEDVLLLGWTARGASAERTVSATRLDDGTILEQLRIAAGESVTVTLLLRFPFGSDAANRAVDGVSTVSFGVLFVLAEDPSPPPPSPTASSQPSATTAPGDGGVLPWTGAALAVGVVIAGLAAFSAGVALVLVQRGRRRLTVRERE